MAVTVTFKNSTEQTFPEAADARRKGGIVTVTNADGTEVGTFHADQIVAVNGKPLPNRASPEN